MYIDQFTKYVESVDITKVKVGELTYPSKNCLLYKGKVFMRDGITNDGTAPTTTTGILGEKTWKDAKSGERAVKVFKDTDNKVVLSMKTAYGWVRIYDDFNVNAERVRFETWLDTVSTIVKKRLYAVDGSTNIYKWTGAVATVQSVATADITIAGTKTLLQLGFDAGTAVAIKLVHISGGVVSSITDYAYTDDCTDGVLHLTSTPTTISAGDLIIATPIKETGKLSGMTAKDDLYTYKNHLAVASLSSETIYFSSALTELDFTIPSTILATSPFSLTLTGNYTAMISRKNILWVSTADEWIKVTKTEEQLPSGLWVSIETFEQPERHGAWALAIAKYKTDIVFLSQDKKLYRIGVVELTGQDDTFLLSDEVEDMLLRLDLTECRLYFFSRYIAITVPRESQLLLLDMVGYAEQGIGAFWQPPQIIPISHIQIIDGERYGHSNATNETFTLFSGESDLDTPIDMIISFGYWGTKNRHELTQFTRIGIDGRINELTDASVTHYFETDGAKARAETIIKGGQIKLFNIPDDINWGAVPWAWRSLAGADLETSPLKRFFVFDKVDAVSWFEYRPQIRVVGKTKQFHLLGISIDEEKSTRKVENGLFITK